MKNIKIKHGKTTAGISKSWLMNFKTEAEMLEGSKNALSNFPEPARTEILKTEYAKLQPAKAEPTAKTEKK